VKILQRLASKSAVIFASRLFGAGIVFLVQAIMARVWGAELLGEYLLIIATMNLISVFVPLGFHTVGTYFAAEYNSQKDGRSLRRFVARSYVHVAVLGGLVTLAGGAVAAGLGEAGQAVADVWIPTSILAVATGTVYLNGAILVGLRRPYAGFFAETLFRPMLLLGAFGIATAFYGGLAALHNMLWMLSLGYAAVALGQLFLVLRGVSAVPSEQPVRAGESRRWWRFAVPWVLISLASDFLFDIDLLLLSGHMERGELAIFGICTRIFSLVSFGVVAVYAVMLPDMYETGASPDKRAFAQKIGEANLVACGIALALVLAVVGGGYFGLVLFGSEFTRGEWPPPTST
jgi:O-antigen/teichoic acid export membrane protein